MYQIGFALAMLISVGNTIISYNGSPANSGIAIIAAVYAIYLGLKASKEK